MVPLNITVFSDRDFDSRFTMCRVTEKDIKTFCTQDPSLHL